MLYSFKSFFPLSDLLLDSLPFCEFDFAEHVTLDDNFFAQLVDLCIDNLVLNGIDRPLFNLVNINLCQKEMNVKKGMKIQESRKADWDLH